MTANLAFATTHRQHTGDDVLAFFKRIDLHTPRHLDVYVVLDNLSAHKSEPVRTWLKHSNRARWRLHFTSTSASWVNLIENWFSLLTTKRLTNSVFTSVAPLVDAIEDWTSHWNNDPKPFVWTEPAADIAAKVRRRHPRSRHCIRDTPLDC